MKMRSTALTGTASNVDEYVQPISQAREHFNSFAFLVANLFEISNLKRFLLRISLPRERQWFRSCREFSSVNLSFGYARFTPDH